MIIKQKLKKLSYILLCMHLIFFARETQAMDLKEEVQKGIIKPLQYFLEDNLPSSQIAKIYIRTLGHPRGVDKMAIFWDDVTKSLNRNIIRPMIARVEEIMAIISRTIDNLLD